MSAAPKAWDYLVTHEELLERRGSSIYRKRPPFSVFGVGAYSFSPWKVAISGLYKKLAFARIGPVGKKPVVLDDTCYLFPCDSEEEADLLYRLVTSEPATEFWSALVFWDAKRPITAKLLNSLNLADLARATGNWNTSAEIIAGRQVVEYAERQRQRLLFS